MEESKNVALLVHVIDASDPNHEEHEKTVLDHEGPGYAGDPRLTLYNKADKVADFTPTQTPFSLDFSALWDSPWRSPGFASRKLRELFVPFTIRVPFQNLIGHDLETVAIIDQREFEEDVEVIQGIYRREK